MKKSSKNQVVELLVEAQNIQSILEEVKPLYSRLDDIVSMLRGMDLSGTGYEVVDQFEDRNTVFRATGISRFKLVKAA